MNTFRIYTTKCNWTVKDDTIKDPVVFLSNHMYKSPASGDSFLVIDDAIISIEHIVAIEKV